MISGARIRSVVSANGFVSLVVVVVLVLITPLGGSGI